MILAQTHHIRVTITSHGLADYPPGVIFGPRTLRDFEFVWIVEGNVVWEADGVDYPAPPGTVLLARPGMRDGFRWDPVSRTRHGYVHFTIDAQRAVLPPLEQWPMVRVLPEGDVMRPLLSHLDWLRSNRPEHWHELEQGVLRQALLAYLSGAVGTVSDVGDDVHPLVAKVLSFARHAWRDGRLRPLSLDVLARAAGVSRAHLARVFREQLGATPVESIRLMRLDRAAALLGRTNLEIQQIADQCGFVNAFHFSRIFHHQYGSSPRAFRKRVAEGEHMPAISLVRVRDLNSRIWRPAPEPGGG